MRGLRQAGAWRALFTLHAWAALGLKGGAIHNVTRRKGIFRDSQEQNWVHGLSNRRQALKPRRATLGLFLQMRKQSPQIAELAVEQLGFSPKSVVFLSSCPLFLHNILPPEAFEFQLWSVQLSSGAGGQSWALPTAPHCQHIGDTAFSNLLFPETSGLPSSPYGGCLCAQPWGLGRKRGAFPLPNAGNFSRSQGSCSHLTVQCLFLLPPDPCCRVHVHLFQ